MSKGPVIDVLRKDDKKMYETFFENNKNLFWRRGRRDVSKGGQYTVIGTAGVTGGLLSRPLSGASKVFSDHKDWVYLPWIDIYDFAKTFGYDVDSVAAELYGVGYPIFALGPPNQILDNLVGVGFIPANNPTSKAWLLRSSLGAGQLIKPPKGVKNPIIASTVPAGVAKYALLSFNDEIPAAVRDLDNMTLQELADAMFVIQNLSKSIIIDVNDVKIAEYGGKITKPIINAFTDKLNDLEAAGTGTAGAISISEYAVEGKYSISYSTTKPKDPIATSKTQAVGYTMKHGSYTYPANFVRTNNIASLDLLLTEMKYVRDQFNIPYGFYSGDRLMDDNSARSAVDAALKNYAVIAKNRLNATNATKAGDGRM